MSESPLWDICYAIFADIAIVAPLTLYLDLDLKVKVMNFIT